LSRVWTFVLFLLNPSSLFFIQADDEAEAAAPAPTKSSKKAKQEETVEDDE
jgi:hypothetical protein